MSLVATLEKNKTAQKKKIGLLGPYGFGNLGDAAIQQAMIENIKKRYPDVEIYGFSLNPEDTEKRHGIPSFSINRIPINDKNMIIKALKRIFLRIPLEFYIWFKSIKYLQDFDILIVSGGGQLDDYWGGALEHPYTLFRWAVASKLSKTRFLIVSVGAGPIDSPLSEWFIKKCLSLANYRSYRDESSKQLIEKIGFLENDPVYPDLAHSLLINRQNKSSFSQSSQLVVGIGPMAYFDPRVWPERDHSVYYGYLEKLANFTSWLIEKQYKIVLFPGEASHDRRVIRDLKELLKKQGISDTEAQIMTPSISTLDQLMAELDQTDIVIASRFHGVLLSYVLHKPVVGISYHPKIDVLMEDLGQSEYCLDIKTFEVDSLIEKFTTLEANLEKAGYQIEQKEQEYRDALDAQYDRVFSYL